jgi:hypothetical protein
VTAATDGAVLADSFKHGTGVGITAANAAAPAPAYTPIAPFGTLITIANNLVGVVPNVADPNGSFGVGAHGDIDNDVNLDLWYVSSVSSTTPASARCSAGPTSTPPVARRRTPPPT